MTSSPIDVTLSCIIINTQRRILHPPFILKVPFQAEHTIIYSFLRSAAPSLRDQETSEFSLYTPINPISLRHEGVLDEAQVDLRAPIGRSSREIASIFPNVRGGNKDKDGVDAIICMTGQPGQDTIQIDLDKASQGPQALLTVRLGTEGSMTRPKQSDLPPNHVADAGRLSKPDFLKEFDEKLTARRAPGLCITTPNYPQLVKDLLGDEYKKFFEDSSTHLASPVELSHYHEILSDEQICRIAAFNANKEHHIYCLLRRLSSGLEGRKIICFNESWPVSMIVQTPDGSSLYTPRSDFHMTVNEFPVLLLEVVSDPDDHSDLRRMQLQAASLVRLGNALTRHKSLDFFIKGIYIDENYRALEHTFYQDTSRSFNQVVYRTEVFDLTKPIQALEFVFRLYNFLDSRDDISNQFANDSSRVYSFVRQMNTKQKTVASRTSRGRSGGTPQATSNQGRSAQEQGRVRAFVQARGYKLLSNVRSTVIKATKHGYTVALKPLTGPGAKNELEILESLQIESPQNHTIQLYDVIRSSLGDILIMPWQTPLDTCLKTSPTVAESLQYQLLEGVWFLHEHGIAHLDLKPDNLVVGYMSVSSSQPKLSIIDYGVSTHAEGEGTLLEGYRGTRDWSAPEVEDAGTGTSKKYSAVLADRWSCGRVLWYIGRKREVDNTSTLASTFTSISNKLLSQDPRSRPPLGPILDNLRVIGAVKRNSGTDSEFVSQKRPRRSLRNEPSGKVYSVVRKDVTMFNVVTC